MADTPVTIDPVWHVDEALLAAVPRLVEQLSPGTPPPGLWELEQMVADQTTKLLVARIDDTIVGMLTLAVFRIPTGVRAWIEDVVVDEAARGRGVGEALTREALRLASERGARTVELTSRPSRKAANRLYQRLGFKERETNVYRYTVDGSSNP